MFRFTLNYYLHKDPTAKDGLFTIKLYIRSKQQTSTLNTTKRILQKDWDTQRQKVKRNVPFELELNLFLEKYKKRVETLLHQIINENLDVTFIEAVEILKQRLNKPKDTFFTAYDNYYNHISTQQKKSSLTKFITLKNHLLEFEKKHKTVITFDGINQIFYDKLQLYFNGENLSVSTVNKLLSTLNSFLTYAVQRELTENIKFKTIKKPKNNFSTKISLTMDELQRFEAVKLNSQQNVARDLFLFCLYSGQRFSDTIKFNVNDCIDNIWYLRQTKTSKPVKIVLNSKLLQILSKHNYSIPKLSNQKVNDHLKVIGKLASIDTFIKKVTFKGGSEQVEAVPKYELLSTHTARRTFVSLAKLKNIDNDLIKQSTGHSSDKMVSTYFQTTEAVDVSSQIFNLQDN